MAGAETVTEAETVTVTEAETVTVTEAVTEAETVWGSCMLWSFFDVLGFAVVPWFSFRDRNR